MLLYQLVLPLQLGSIQDYLQRDSYPNIRTVQELFNLNHYCGFDMFCFFVISLTNLSHTQIPSLVIFFNLFLKWNRQGIEPCKSSSQFTKITYLNRTRIIVFSAFTFRHCSIFLKRTQHQTTNIRFFTPYGFKMFVIDKDLSPYMIQSTTYLIPCFIK